MFLKVKVPVFTSFAAFISKNWVHFFSFRQLIGHKQASWKGHFTIREMVMLILHNLMTFYRFTVKGAIPSVRKEILRRERYLLTFFCMPDNLNKQPLYFHDGINWTNKGQEYHYCSLYATHSASDFYQIFVLDFMCVGTPDTGDGDDNVWGMDACKGLAVVYWTNSCHLKYSHISGPHHWAAPEPSLLSSGGLYVHTAVLLKQTGDSMSIESTLHTSRQSSGSGMIRLRSGKPGQYAVNRGEHNEC